MIIIQLIFGIIYHNCAASSVRTCNNWICCIYLFAIYFIFEAAKW